MAYGFFVSCALIALLGPAALIDLQEKKLERMRIGGGSATATQMPLWFAKEGGYYENNGLSVERRADRKQESCGIEFKNGYAGGTKQKAASCL